MNKKEEFYKELRAITDMTKNLAIETLESKLILGYRELNLMKDAFANKWVPKDDE